MDTDTSNSSAAAGGQDEPQLSPVAFVLPFAAWLVPGIGHLLLGRRRGVAFLVLIAASLAIGLSLEGNLHRILPNQPLTILATLGSIGMGIPYFVLRFAIGYQGSIVGAGYEYGTAFLLTAGLMNWLLVLDVWDIATGKKS